jgi:hypothetical protein
LAIPRGRACGASRRHGIQLVGFRRPLPWLALDGSYTASHAHYDDDYHIPNALENAAAAGISIVGGGWEGALRMRHLGRSPLVEGNSVRDSGSTVFNLRAAGSLRMGASDAVARYSAAGANVTNVTVGRYSS